MESDENRTRTTGERRRSRGLMRLATLVLAMSCIATAGRAAEEGSEQAKDLLDALIGGKPTLNVRGRIEVAKTEGSERSEAYTVRTRLGYGTKPWHGIRVYTNFENLAAATEKTYFNPTDPPNDKNQTVIADPPGTEVNEGYLEIARKDWLDSRVRAGRQAIVYDDSRFIGDVIWRQNQQTYDGVEARSSLGLDGFQVRYGWIGNVNRIFGGGGTNPNLQDFQSNSQLVHLSYGEIPQAKVSVFAYLLDLENSQATGDPSGNSSQTYGFRANGAFDLTEQLGMDYIASYAWQADYGDKAVDYSASYVDAELGFKWKGLGRVAGGFEMLGSDDGVQQFQTPLATAHKFNGWADVYLNNGGPTGLKDLRVAVAPALPWKLSGAAIYHRFWDDATGDVRGNEIDAVLKRPFGKHVLLLAKGAYFMGDDDFASPDPDTWRFWFDVVIKF